MKITGPHKSETCGRDQATEYDNSGQQLQVPPESLTPQQKERIREQAYAFYLQCGIHTDLPEILFDLKGKAAGQWRMTCGREQLRFNAQAFVLDWDAHFPNTIAHEVAHSLVYRRQGRRRPRPHGPEWKAQMRSFGCEPRVTHRTPLRGRTMKTYEYVCACQGHSLSARRHSLIQRKRYRYHCRECGRILKIKTPE
ncbi:SprT-like domain-containing protein [Thioalkalivibrio sp. ALJ7]|uniref:SprT family zinc-dependent metalloprotease n=1 Tax=Thioalkalivibrio sp. ALJ7 TaxID=1158756 RepID=UPI0009D914FA|nr:SprT-like domain-containing protein [Thioalkalivibrio sp. ALJ7]